MCQQVFSKGKQCKWSGSHALKAFAQLYRFKMASDYPVIGGLRDPQNIAEKKMSNGRHSVYQPGTGGEKNQQKVAICAKKKLRQKAKKKECNKTNNKNKQKTLLHDKEGRRD